MVLAIITTAITSNNDIPKGRTLKKQKQKNEFLDCLLPS